MIESELNLLLEIVDLPMGEGVGLIGLSGLKSTALSISLINFSHLRLSFRST